MSAPPRPMSVGTRGQTRRGASPAGTRLLRGGVVAGWALGISVVAHGWAGGEVPSGPALLPLAVVALVAGCVVTARQVGFVRALATLLLLQPLLHLELHTLTHPAPASMSVAGTAWHVEPAMLLAHVAASLAGAAWIAWADGWLARVLGRIWLTHVLLDSHAVAVALAPRPPSRGLTWSTRDVVPGLGSRGPPVPRVPVLD